LLDPLLQEITDVGRMSRRGRPPKYPVSSTPVVVDKVIPPEDKRSDTKKDVIAEVENVKKVIHQHLKRKIEKINNLEKEKTELFEKISALEFDKRELSKRIQSSEKQSTTQREHISQLLRQIKERDEKLTVHNQKTSKLLELIEPLQKKVKEQEYLEEQLGKANDRNKSLNAANKALEETLQIKEKERHEGESIVSEERQRLGIFEKKIKSELSAESKRIADERKDIQSQKKNYEDQKVTLDMQWDNLKYAKKKLAEEQKVLADEQKVLADEQKVLAEEQKVLAEDQKVLAEEQQELAEDKIAIDTEWGEIWTKKEKLEKLQTSLGADGDATDKLKLGEMEIENRNLLEKISLKTREYEDLFKMHNHLGEQLSAFKEGSEKEVLKLKSDIVKVKLSKSRYKEDIKSLKNEMGLLQDQLSSSKETCAKYELEFKKMVDSKDQQLNEMEQRLSSANTEKRKRIEEEVQDEVIHKKFRGDRAVDHFDSADANEYLPSDMETGIDDLDITDNHVIEENDPNAMGATNESNSLVANIFVNAVEDKAVDTVADTSDVLKQIDDFESLIKNKRLQDSSSGDTINKSDATEGRVSDSDGSSNITTEDETRRETLNYSDETLHSPNSDEDGVRNVEHLASLHDPDTNDNNTAEHAADKSRREKPLLILKNIDSLVFSPVDQDIIVPRISDTADDSAIEDPETADGGAKENQEKVERELKFKVGQWVTNVLNSFYKKENGIESREEFSKIASEFTNQFVSEIKDSYRWSHNGSLDGLSMTKDDKLSITDQIYLHFNVKVAVTKHLTVHVGTINPSSPEFATMETLTSRLSKEIKESYKMIHNTLLGVSVTEDVKLMIRNNIDTQFSKQC